MGIMTGKVQKIREEVEKLKSQLLRGACSSQVAMEARCKEEAYNEVLAILDSMQEEPKECMYSKGNYTDEDRKVLCDSCEEKCELNKKEEPVSEELEEEALVYAATGEISLEGKLVIDKEIYETFKAGANWQKEQMMAKAVDVTVHIDAGGYPYIPQMELYDYDKDIPLAKEGDKYKVILIKAQKGE